MTKRTKLQIKRVREFARFARVLLPRLIDETYRRADAANVWVTDNPDRGHKGELIVEASTPADAKRPMPAEEDMFEASVWVDVVNALLIFRNSAGFLGEAIKSMETGKGVLRP